MPHAASETDLNMRLRKFHIDLPYNAPDSAWMPRDPVARVLDAGLRELTKGPKGFMSGLNEKDFPVLPKCRYCGCHLHIVRETMNAIIWGCSTEGCRNNQDTKSNEWFMNQQVKKPIGKIEEDQF